MYSLLTMLDEIEARFAPQRIDLCALSQRRRRHRTRLPRLQHPHPLAGSRHSTE